MNTKGQEIEVKFYVRRLESVGETIESIGGIIVQPRISETNLRFDTPDHELERDFRVLRLRKDSAARMTYKGPGSYRDGVRSRQEIEFEVSDFDAARAFLQALGYRVSMIYEKFRTVYRLGEVDVALDELPYGKFIEIEGPNAEVIHQASDRLGLNWDASAPGSYAVLFEALRRRMNLPFRDLIFQNFVGIEVTAELLGVRPADSEITE